MSGPSPTASASAPRITVAVCTRNRASALKAAIQSLARLQHDDAFELEVVVIDNDSTDETDHVLAEAQAAHHQLSLRVVRETRVGFAYARNRAIAEARGDWIAFFDDDQIADPAWLSELWRVASCQQADCVGGAVRLQTCGSFVPGHLCKSLLGQTDPRQIECRFDSSFQPGTGSLLIRRRLLDELGGFATDRPGRGEDTRLFDRMRRAGYEGWFAPRSVVHHVIPLERNQPDAYRALAKACADAEDLACRKWGSWLPLVTATRFVHLVIVRLPLLAGVTVCGSPAHRLDQQCRTILCYWRGVRECQLIRHAWRQRISRRWRGASLL